MKKRPLFFAGTVFVLVLYLLLQWKEDLFYSAALAAEASFSDGDSVMFSGTVKSIENKEKQTVLTLRNAQIVVDNRSYESNGLLVYTEDIQACNPGEKISGYGKLNKIVKPENPGQFDARRYYNGKKVDYRIFSSEILEKNEKRDYYLCLLESIKGKLEAGIENVFGEKDAGILKSMLLGDKSGMDEETYAMFQLAGIAHVFAISGLHVALVGRGVYNLLRKTGLGFAGSFLISTILIISYGIMTGGSPSAIRAVIMFGLSVFAKVCGRSYDLLTAVMTALVFILIENPYAIQQSGVWLSFGAVLGIGIISPVFEKVIKPERALTKSFLVSYSVHLFTLPLVAVSFYQFSTYGILLNLIVIPLMTFVFLSGGAAGVCGIFLASLGHFIGGMAHYILLFYEKLCQFYIQIPGGIFVTGKPEKWQVILYYVLLLTILYGINLHRKNQEGKNLCKKCTKEENRQRIKKTFLIKAVTVFAPAVLLIVLLPLPQKGLSVTMLDLGQGEGIYIQEKTKNGISLFVDGGSSDVSEVGKYRILPFLKSKGVNHIERWLITHADSDHYSGFLEILEEVKKGTFSIDMVCIPKPLNPSEGYEKITEAVKEAGIRLSIVEKGTKWKYGKTSVLFLHPEMDYESESENAYSAVFLLKYGSFCGLFTGDVEGEGETALEPYLKGRQLTFLKVAHHGSSNSTTEKFSDLINPEIAFISAGVDNSYGHPSKEVLERLQEKKCRIYVTQKLGAIWLKTDGKRAKTGYFLEK